MFQGLKTEHQPFLAFLGCKGQIQIAYSVLSNEKALPYQFGLATIKGFQDHLHTMCTRTKPNQPANIVLLLLILEKFSNRDNFNRTNSFIRVYSYLPNLRWGPFIDNCIWFPPSTSPFFYFSGIFHPRHTFLPYKLFFPSLAVPKFCYPPRLLGLPLIYGR